MNKDNVHLFDDSYLTPYREIITRRNNLALSRAEELSKGPGSLSEFSCAHEYYGFHLRDDEWIFREYAPNAVEIFLIGDFTGWQKLPAFSLMRLADGKVWEGRWPKDAIHHKDRYHLLICWNEGQGERIPAYTRRVIQSDDTGLYEAQIWQPEEQYKWKNKAWSVPKNQSPLIYEAHIGMAQEKYGVGSYEEFRRFTLPRIIKAGYNTIQLMAIMEHPYYGSFGYHVGSFFAASSRFGTPEELKALIDAAHEAGIAVIMDIVHSHAVKNERDGLSRFDGTYDLYFHSGTRGWHETWDSRCFNYGKVETLHFLLSNIRYWLDEFHFDGFRFDGVTSMLYLHHGLGVNFTDYSMYFDYNTDDDAVVYCSLANRLIHELRPDAITIAEDMSGMPGLAAPIEDGGIGFNYRMAMGVPDCWFKLVGDIKDEDWSIGYLWHELTNRREEEKTICYVESHDQALVGGKTLIFEMLDSAIYDSMHRGVNNLTTDRGVALHKMIRLATLASSGSGYLNFMGNEFGHPEWIDFPRAENGNSYAHARRQWSLADDKGLFFYCLKEFDAKIVNLVKENNLLSYVPRFLTSNDNNKLLVFERGGLIFIFNFHASEPLVDYPIIVPPGQYKALLNSDSVAYGGFDRITEDQDYPVFNDKLGNEIVQRIRVYLPPRTAIVIQKV